MTEYTPPTWNTGNQFTAAQASAMSAELDEQEGHDLSQDELITLLQARVAVLEAKAAVVHPVERMGDGGFATLHRILPGGAVALVSGRIQLEYFTAPDTWDATTITKTAGSTAMSGTAPTMIKFGVYSVAPNGDLTLIAVAPNDPALFTAAFSFATKTFVAPCPFVRGNLYATATLVITAGTIGNMWGTSSLGGGMLDDAPALAKQVTGQTDLPSFIPTASALAAASVYTFTRFS